MVHTLKDVEAALLQIVSSARTERQRYGYFASLYLSMTRSVGEGIKKGAFDDGPRMERLVVHFASRYLDAFSAWQANKPVSTSWKIAFEQTRLDRLTVIQHLLCGMNAHINLDLCIAAAVTCPGNSIHSLKKDFYKINQVIGSLMDSVQNKLSKIAWPMRMLDRIGRNLDEKIAGFGIGAARDTAWKEALVLAATKPEQQPPLIHILDNTTTALGRLIINPGIGAGMILKMVKWTEPQDVRKIMDVLAA